jgi:hypothetical protein
LISAGMKFRNEKFRCSIPAYHHVALRPNSGPGLPFWGFVTITVYMAGLLVQRPTPNQEDQASVFMTPGDRVAQLYPQALGTPFSRLLRHE